jgi:hypothetical protein
MPTPPSRQPNIRMCTDERAASTSAKIRGRNCLPSTQLRGPLPGDATRRAVEHLSTQRVAWIAVSVAMVAVSTTWLTDEPVTLNGAQGPNNGWLVVVLVASLVLGGAALARGLELLRLRRGS